MASRSPSKGSSNRGLRGDDDGTQQPLLGVHSSAAAALLTNANGDDNDNHNHNGNNHNNSPLCTLHHASRRRLQRFLSSRAQHFCVLVLVALDLLGIFADIFIDLYTCESGPSAVLDGVKSVLGVMGLMFR
jgi:hypothetical protein